VWIDKILTFLRRRFSSGQFGFDKWHISPYYFAGLAVQSLPGIADELVHAHVKWIRETQRRDGGWGYCGRSTPEETAYCLQALILWDHSVERVEQDQLKAAADYLALHLDDRHLPLWIGKCLYTPVNVVRAAILAALYSYMTHGE
jgi:halimadienyl-diphosphate synthase